MAVPIGTPMTEAILKPAANQEIKMARLLRGAITLQMAILSDSMVRNHPRGHHHGKSRRKPGQRIAQ